MKTVRCNRCQEKFESPVEINIKFEGYAAARITSDFMTCPHCGQTDNHWLYAVDYMPAGMNRKQQRDWLEAN